MADGAAEAAPALSMIERILGLILVGLVVGGLGRLLHPGIDPMPIWMTIVIGLVASLIGGLVVPGLLGFVLAIVIAAVLVGLVARGYRQYIQRYR